MRALVLATWDICSGNWSAVHDEGGLLAKTWEMRVQSTQSILRPFSQRRGPLCVVCLSLNQAIHLFLLLRASRAGVAVDEAINDLPCTQYARGSDQKQGRTAGGKRALTRASDRPAPTGQTPCVPEDGPVPPGARCAPISKCRSAPAAGKSCCRCCCSQSRSRRCWRWLKRPRQS